MQCVHCYQAMSNVYLNARRLFPWITFAVVLYISDIISVEVEEEDEEDEEDEDMGKNEEAEGGRIVLGSFIPIPFSERLNPSRVPLPESQIALLNKLKNDQDFCHTLRRGYNTIYSSYWAMTSLALAWVFL